MCVPTKLKLEDVTYLTYNKPMKLARRAIFHNLWVSSWIRMIGEGEVPKF